jgi:hypothetical protein
MVKKVLRVAGVAVMVTPATGLKPNAVLEEKLESGGAAPSNQ